MGVGHFQKQKAHGIKIDFFSNTKLRNVLLEKSF